MFFQNQGLSEKHRSVVSTRIHCIHLGADSSCVPTGVLWVSADVGPDANLLASHKVTVINLVLILASL